MVPQPSKELYSVLEGPKGAVPGGFPRWVRATWVPGDLYALKQHSRETRRRYIQRFTQKMNTIPCIKQELVIASLHTNVRTVRMREKLSNHQVESTRELWELVDWCARAEEGAKFHEDDDPKRRGCSQ